MDHIAGLHLTDDTALVPLFQAVSKEADLITFIIPRCAIPCHGMTPNNQSNTQTHPQLTMGYSKLEPKFNLGRIVATSGVMSLGIDLIPFIRRHHYGEWGDLCADDKASQ